MFEPAAHSAVKSRMDITMIRIFSLGLCGLVVTVGLAPTPTPSQVKSPMSAGPRAQSTRIKHTYSIVARDPATGEMGVAVQTHVPFVGVGVPWAEAGVGAVATQSVTDPNYGKLGLEMMRAGKSAPTALQSLLAGDDDREKRQGGRVESQRRARGHTAWQRT